MLLVRAPSSIAIFCAGALTAVHTVQVRPHFISSHRPGSMQSHRHGRIPRTALVGACSTRHTDSHSNSSFFVRRFRLPGTRYKHRAGAAPVSGEDVRRRSCARGRTSTGRGMCPGSHAEHAMPHWEAFPIWHGRRVQQETRMHLRRIRWAYSDAIRTAALPCTARTSPLLVTADNARTRNSIRGPPATGRRRAMEVMSLQTVHTSAAAGTRATLQDPGTRSNSLQQCRIRNNTPGNWSSGYVCDTYSPLGHRAHARHEHAHEHLGAARRPV
ncbi:hypothetical protein C8Q77DRAFT_125585 [Trametes polyzona]|nr:hypothetical protein C8Q77DRAFT_125585 [Trametes polyzona]